MSQVVLPPRINTGSSFSKSDYGSEQRPSLKEKKKAPIMQLAIKVESLEYGEIEEEKKEVYSSSVVKNNIT